MATYEEIYGKRVKELSTDPTLNSSYEGQVWYNENTGTLKLKKDLIIIHCQIPKLLI